MKAKVDADLCISCAVCANMVPDWFVMNDDGVAECPSGDVPSELEEQVREAAEECPSEAIQID